MSFRFIIALASLLSVATVSAAQEGQEKIDTLATATVTSAIDRNINFTQTGLTKIDGSAFRRGFAVFSSPDVLKTLQTLTGVSSGTEMLSNLYVHGGDGSDNLFLLDGVPLYQICHLGGIFSSFNTDVVEGIDFYKSGFPARYGGRTSSVVDVATKDGDFKGYHGTVGIGLLDGRLQFEGPIIKDRTSFNVAMRRSWIDVISAPACAIMNSMNKEYGEKQNFGYSFTDLNARVTHILNRGSRLTANLYWGNDGLRITQEFEGHDQDGSLSDIDIEDTRFSWGNLLGSLNWQKEFSDKLDMRLLGFYSGSRSDIRMNTTLEYYRTDYTDVFRQDTHNRNRVNDGGVSADFNWYPHHNHHIRFGGTYILHSYSPSHLYSQYDTDSGEVLTDINKNDDIHSFGNEMGIYAEDEMSLTRWMKVNLGLRYSLYEAEEKIWNYFEPRAALKFQVSPNVGIKASYSEMSQFSHLVAATYIDLPTNSWLPSTSKVAPMRSRQVAGGIYGRLPHNMHLNVEGWYKTMSNLIEYKGMNSFFPPLTDWEDDFKTGIGKSYGLEVDFGYETEKTSVSAFYTLSWNWRKFDDIWPDWYLDRNDNKHKITVVANHRFTEKFEMYASWNYHTGNRMTVASQYLPAEEGAWTGKFLYESPNNAKMPDYHRLDVGFNFYRKTKRGNMSVWNLSVYNAYCRINPLYASVVKDKSKLAFEGLGIGIIPIVPTFSYTFRF